MPVGRTAALALALGGCNFMHGLAPAVEDGAGSDVHSTGSDGKGSDGGAGCFGAGLANVCSRMPVPSDWTVSSPLTFDTGQDCDFTVTIAGQLICVKQATDVTITDTLGLIGPLPLVILAEHDLSVSGQGSIDASSVAGGAGPGANAMQCASGTPGGSENANSGGSAGGGGAGGSFGGVGGAGSSGSKPGGMPGATIAATSIHGGCAGTAGGNQKGNRGGAPGAGGGAVYLIAGHAISIDGVIDASGAGALAGSLQAGGGGGGSGGFVGIDAPSVRVSANAEVFANGGGGGEGGDPGAAGANGTEPAQATVAAAGGAGLSNGGDGGDGSSGSDFSGRSGLPRGTNGAGGGGGGAAGAIRIFTTAPQLDGALSPPPS